MAVKIAGVHRGSHAHRAGIVRGDTLLTINGEEINDVIDYQFYISDHALRIQFEAGGEQKTATIEKPQYDDIGLQFDSYLMDNAHHCTNKCVFCFVDQMPKGLRDTLYFKDDDSRLSFFFGNYVTLTNMKESEIDRIIKMKISPINISVHTTNPELRVEMMKNPHSASSLRFLKKLADAGIKINTQLVLCPDVNDGPELLRSLRDLEGFYPSLLSVACVPVGLTKYRDGLYPLKGYTREAASETLDQILQFGEQMHTKYGARIVYPADEFFVLARRDLPDCDFYEDFSQLENGVGMLALLKEEFYGALEDLQAENVEVPPRTLTLATGVAAHATLKALADAFHVAYPQVHIDVRAIENHFFGTDVTVAGLITPADLKAQLLGNISGNKLCLPSVMLRAEQDVFLDGVHVDELAAELGVEIEIIKGGGETLLGTFAGTFGENNPRA